MASRCALRLPQVSLDSGRWPAAGCGKMPRPSGVRVLLRAHLQIIFHTAVLVGLVAACI